MKTRLLQSSNEASFGLNDTIPVADRRVSVRAPNVIRVPRSLVPHAGTAHAGEGMAGETRELLGRPARVSVHRLLTLGAHDRTKLARTASRIAGSLISVPYFCGDPRMVAPPPHWSPA